MYSIDMPHAVPVAQLYKRERERERERERKDLEDHGVAIAERYIFLACTLTFSSFHLLVQYD
jgi:hypothetical protein